MATTILRQHISHGVHLQVCASKLEAIQKVKDPFATIHTVPEALVEDSGKGENEGRELLSYVHLQVLNNQCLSVRKLLLEAQMKQQQKET